MKQNFIIKGVVKLFSCGSISLKAVWIIFILPLIFFSNQVLAQSNISYVEYYVDQDPGLNLATPVPITPGINVAGVSVSIDVNNLSRGVHIFGTRARTLTGVWSMSHYWFIFKPYIAITPAALTNITRVEYYVDTDPGLGNGIAATITPATNLTDITFSINPVPLVPGVHIIGTRSLTANGLWSKTNFWLFFKPYSNFTPGVNNNINYVEYYLDTDPGIGKATLVSITPGLNLSDINLPLNITNTKNGTHILGIRSRDAANNWSKTNFWLFVKPYSNIATGALSNTTALEYYLDYDPGYDKGTPVTIAPNTNFSDVNFNVDVSTIIAGNHYLVARARDANGNWSMVNSWQFTIPGVPPVLSSLISTVTLCAGSAINVGYQLNTPISFAAGNKFIAQLSDASGNFTTPSVIGSLTTTANSGLFTGTIPADATSSGSYRIRVISTQQSILGADNGSNITIYALPPLPTVTKPTIDTTICQGNQLQLIASGVSGSPQWLLNGVPVPGANSATYTVASAAPVNAGAYRLRVTSSGTCNVVTPVINISINTNVPATPTISPNGNIGVCLGSSTTLTSTAATNNQWFNNGVAILGATNTTYNATAAGTYFVTTNNGSCTAASSNNALVTLGVPPTIPSVIIGGPTTFCQGSSVVFTSSAFNNNQWLRNGVIIPGATGTSLNISTSGFYKVQASNNNCVVFSDSTQVIVNPTLVPAVSIVASANNVPIGTSITFTATPVNGGATPQYDFRVNNVSVQTGPANTFTSAGLANGVLVNCILTSNVACASTPFATSNNLTANFLNPVLISGRIITPLKAVIPGPKIYVTDGLSDSTSTDATGRYQFSLFQQRNYTITPTKNNDVVKANGVNVLDVLQVQAHIIGSTLLNSAYKVIAADVNSDAAINVTDVLLIKRLILGYDTTFPGKKLWAFVDSLETFPNPLNPFPFLNIKAYTNLSAPQSNQSFYGVKLGDVNQDWAAIPGFNRPIVTGKSLQLYYDTVYVDNNDEARVRVRVRNFKDILGMQFTIGFNSQTLQFAGIENKNLAVQFADNHASKGALTFIWADAGNEPKTLKDGYVLFDIILKKKQNFDLEDLSIITTYSPAIAYIKGYIPKIIEKTEGAIADKRKPSFADNTGIEKFDVSPNPNNGLMRVSMVAAAAKKVSLIVSDVTGRVVFKKSYNLLAGLNEFPLNIRRETYKTPGVYFISAKGLQNVATKSLLIKNEY
jgi:hypothetical protein